MAAGEVVVWPAWQLEAAVMVTGLLAAAVALYLDLGQELRAGQLLCVSVGWQLSQLR